MKICQDILNDNLTTNDVKFQAAIAFRQSFLIYWNSMHVTDQSMLIELLYKYIMYFSQQQTKAIASTFREALAHVYKLLWMNIENEYAMNVNN